jgi:hypothetical protein
VTSAGNPILLDLKTRYKVKGIGAETTIQSTVEIHTADDGRISMVVDKWNGKLPDGAFTQASWSQLCSFWWWVHYGEAWAWWGWSRVWWTRPLEVGWIQNKWLLKETTHRSILSFLFFWRPGLVFEELYLY